jgi:hypothetical protein
MGLKLVEAEKIINRLMPGDLDPDAAYALLQSEENLIELTSSVSKVFRVEQTLFVFPG